MAQLPRRRPWLPALLIFLGVGVVISALAIPGLVSAERASNERNASTALKTLTSAEADFRANDRDHNGVNDFWTGDVSGLYSLDVGGGPLKLILREIAEADAAPIKALVPVPVPYHGYFFRALDLDAGLKGSKEAEYRCDTGGKPPMGKVHHESRFGFIAYPAKYGQTGKYSFLINENNTVFRRPEDGTSISEFPSSDELFGTKISFDKTPATPTRRIQDAVSELPRTTVTPHLGEPHVAGRNLMWCATVQLAWDSLGTLMNAPLDLQGSPAAAVGLNRRLVGTEALPPGKFYAKGGFFKNGVLGEIQRDMAEKFPEASMPQYSQPGPYDEALAFAYLRTNLPFACPLYRHAGITFDGKKVAAFGTWDGHTKKPTDAQLKEMTVRDFGADTNFVLELHPKSEGERIIVARVPPGKTLFDTIASVMNRADSPGGGVTERDEVMIPCLNFELTRAYGELTGPAHRFLHGDGWIADARQLIKFRLDEEGAALESFAYFWTVLNGDPPKGRRMICDGPFLILLARSGSKLPYFAFWVENDELLIH